MMFPCSSLTVWSFFTAGLLTLFASALIFSPRFLLFLSLSLVEERSALTSLETFLALQFGVYMVAVALALILNIPGPKTPIPSSDNDAASTHPLLTPVTMAGCVSAFVSWNSKEVGALATILFIINAIIGIWGMWIIHFANSSSISKTTGADKRTSAFIFGNKAAASSQKKALKLKKEI